MASNSFVDSLLNLELRTWETTSILVAVCTALLAYIIWRKQPKTCGFPDGPVSFPILGNLLQIVMSGSMETFICKCKREFGNVFTIEIGGSKRVVVLGYSNIYSLVVKNADFTSNRTVQSLPPSTIKASETAPGLLWAPFPHWKTIRSFSLNVLREEGMGKQKMEPKLLDEIDKFCDYFIESRFGQPIDVKEGLCMATCNIISEMIFGGRNEYDDPKFSQLMGALDSAVRSDVKAGITKNIPLAKYFKSSGLQIAHEAFHTLINEMMKKLSNHRSDLDASNPKDIFDMFLLHQSTAGGKETAFADGNASVIALQLYGGGTETTSTALRWALLYTCLHPQVKQKVQDEIRKEIGEEKSVSYKDRNNLPYTEAVLLETLRIAKIFPNAFPHKLEKSLVVDGKVIPGGADLMLNLASVLHDEELFEEPEKFNPDRYLIGDVALKKQRTIPFGLGRRICLGESLARMEFFMFYVTLLQRYDIRLSDKSLHVCTLPVTGLVNQPQAYSLEFNKLQWMF